MKFKEWFFINEIDHHSLEVPQTLNGIKCDGIDFRFEDWKKGLKQPKNQIQMPSPKKYIMSGSYKAPCKEGWFVIDNRHSERPQSSGNVALASQTQTDIQVVQELSPEIEELLSLPKAWFLFAILYLGNQVVKQPEWPRSESEVINRGRVEMS